MSEVEKRPVTTQKPRTGADYINSLRDGRAVYLDGQKIENYVDHPAFRNVIRSAAKLYDYQAANEEKMTFVTPTGAVSGKSWELPTTEQKLIERGEAAYAWAKQTYGWLGRSPDHVAAALTGMVTHIDVFKAYSEERADVLLKYYEYARDKDIYLTYTIVNPQGDRSKSPGEHTKNLNHTLGVVSEEKDGIIVKGAKMLGTASVMAEEVFVAVHDPLKAGIDDRYALSFAIPLNAKGIKILSRKSYEADTTQFDNPLSHQFDESDALVYFDNVFVPWDRVFIYKDTDMCRKQFHLTGAEILMDTQSQARYAVKLHFLVGLAQRITQTIGVTDFPSVRETLADLACQATIIDGLYRRLIYNPHKHGEYFIPDQLQLHTCQAISQVIYPKVIETIRRLSGGGVIMLPSSVEDLKNPEIREMIETTQYSAIGTPLDRVKFMKLAWDAIGSEFGSRHVQYEMFYSGPRHGALSRVYAHYDWEDTQAMLDELLGSYDIE